MIGFDVTDVTAINIGNVGIGSIYVGGTKIWEDTPTPPVHDYERDYLTTTAKGSGNMTFDIPAEITTNEVVSVSYSTDDGNTWTTTNNVDNQQITITVPVNNGDKVLWKGNADKYFIYSGGNIYGTLNGTIDFDAEGNIMSLLYGDNFYQTSLSSTSTFFGLFYRSNIVNASNLILSSITATHDCYFWMFCGCTKLTDAPKINATTLDGGCYYGMFQECTSLTTAPALPATTLAMNCYVSMFNGCSSLNYIKMLATDISAYSCLDSWVDGVSATGTFVKDVNMTTLPTGTSGIPNGWTVEDYPPTPVHDYERDYFTTVAKGNGNITFTIPSNISTSDFTSISYSTDNGSTWTTTNNEDNQAVNVTVGVSEDDKVLWKGTGIKLGSWRNTVLNANVDFDLEGNIMSLINGDNFYHSSLSDTRYIFAGIFFNVEHLINAANLILPATEISELAYQEMFCNCQYLVSAPLILGTSVDYRSCMDMFNNCTSLSTIQNELYFTTLLDEQCCLSMFSGCTSLTTAPALPATTLTNSCYDSMFSGCTSLTTAPALPATTLTNSCYREMFSGCNSLTNAPALSATTLVECCYGGMFKNCTSLTNVPTTLPATTLKYFCYQNMFMGCSSLTTAPILPATTLTDSCYNSMFSGCSNLNYIKMLATDISASNCLGNWVNNVSATGTFVKNASMTTLPTGTSGIPSGWTIEDDSSNLLSSVTAE